MGNVMHHTFARMYIVVWLCGVVTTGVKGYLPFVIQALADLSYVRSSSVIGITSMAKDLTGLNWSYLLVRNSPQQFRGPSLYPDDPLTHCRRLQKLLQVGCASPEYASHLHPQYPLNLLS
ncbi:uncharacterized protein EI90DRAFT_3037327 [Cantharellus anzutake]|uniref:uncharacterized protein n=1 Tax=Cantharellus anzutake TaxID=1750568 RepID=UPI001905C6CB|nr:uncharacterized protein EI90DRAFT_3037327 [Cantharellus anzutake]KAF8339640.1 hypothetical protein EI90DRAFT_3037327 [Cantharellus anzutake]